MKRFVLCFSLLLLLMGGTTYAVPIGIGSFSGSETVETFTSGFGISFAPVTHNGVTYSSLGSGLGNSGLNASDNWNPFFSNILGSSQGISLNDEFGESLIRIDFSTPVNRVGLLLSTTPVTTWTITAFDNLFSPLESVIVTMPDLEQAVFVGIERPENIARLEISESFDNGHLTIADDLRYEVIPEPSTYLLFAVGILGIIGMGYRQRKKAA